MLIGEYREYNIVNDRGRFYAVPQSHGPLNLSKEEDRNRVGILIAKERKEVELR